MLRAAMLSRFVVTSAVLSLLAGCAEARTAPRQGGNLSEASADVSSTTDASAADVAQVVCERDAVRLQNPVVRAKQDGVHFLIKNPGGAWGVDLHHESWAYGTGEGFKLSDEMTPDTSAMGPGTVTVACVPKTRSSYYDPGVPTTTLTIVDPAELYVPWKLACGFGDQFRMTIAAGAKEDPVSVAQRVPGVMSTDDFKRPNYPDSPRYGPMEFIVLRDGQGLARVMGTYYDGEWHLIINACPGSGIHN